MIDYDATFVNTDGSAFPDTEAVNATAPGAGDGTEFVAAMVNDIWGRAQALMDYAGLTPDGAQEAPDTAQILTALKRGFGIGPGIGVIYWKNDTPAAKNDRVLLLQGQVVLIATYPLLVAETYVGDPDNATAPAFYKTSDAGGTTRDTAGTYFVLPDARGLSLKMLGDATISGRTKTGPTELGEKQEDQGQQITGDYTNAWLTGASSGAFSGSVNGGTNRPPGAALQAIDMNFDSANSTATPGGARVGDNTRDSSLGTNFGITY